MEDCDWEKADEYCEKVLDFDPENAQAYLGKLLVQLRLKKVEDLPNHNGNFSYSSNYQKTYRFGSDDLRTQLEIYNKQAIYNQAINEMNAAEDDEQYNRAKSVFETIKGFLDVDKRIKECENKVLEYYYQKALFLMKEAKTDNDFQKAEKEFEKLGNYFDAKHKVFECQSRAIEQRYQRALLIMKEARTDNDFHETEKEFKNLGNYSNAKQKAKECKERAFEYIQKIELNKLRMKKAKGLISASNKHIVCLKSDRTVVAIGKNIDGQCNVSNFYDIVAIVTEDYLTVGVRSDGTVAVIGNLSKYDPYCRLDNYDVLQYYKEILSQKNIISVAISNNGLICLKKDGSIWNRSIINLSTWKNVISIVAAGENIAGLRSDGTVVSYKYKTAVSWWNNIVDIAVNRNHIVGLKSDGTVVEAGDHSNYCRYCLSSWKNIVSIAISDKHVVGLKADGTIEISGNKYGSISEALKWEEIIAISTSDYHIVGLKSDGTIVTAGSGGYDLSLYNIENIKLFEDIDHIEEERNRLKVQQIRILQQKRRLTNCCQYCGGTFKGLLVKACRICGRKKDY
ncbi:MAG: hypothetical protein K2G88_06300 [Oscillospiraceae bacterium]|nr:hypothetical protein [Oscillospiraceae bacterium]